MRLRDRAKSRAADTGSYCIRDRESFGKGVGGEKGKPVARDAIYAKRYCPDKAVRFCSRTSSGSPVWQYEYLPIYSRFTRYDYPERKKRNVSEKGSNAVRYDYSP
jgi:hypothetical protein